MPIYEIEDPKTKKVYEIEAPKMPSGAQIQSALLGINRSAERSAQPAPAPAQAGPRQPAAGRGTNINLARSYDFAQGAGSSIPFVGPDMPASGAGLAGRVAGEAALLAVPVERGVALAGKVLPSAARAGAKFQSVMAAAKNVPVDVEAPGQVALRIQQLAERGGSMPKAVRDFLKRVTDPEKPAMVYEELRDFASNISRLSANEFGRLTPAVAREVHALRLAINKSAEGAAAQAGKGGEYLSAMNEYRNAARGRELWDATKKNVLRYAVPGGIGAYGLGKLSDLVRGD